MKLRAAFLAWATLGLAACAPGVGEEFSPLTSALETSGAHDDCHHDPRVVAGIVSEAECAGARLFFKETFDGNGRVCASCHRVEHNFTIDPDFIATLPPSDPLFVAERDPGGPLTNLEVTPLLHDCGLILVNADGQEDPTRKFVVRSVPHIFSVATALLPTPGDSSTVPPVHRTGWAGDGAPNSGALRDFATGAVTQHLTRSLARRPGVDFRLPTGEELDQLESYLRGVGRRNELDLSAVRMADGQAELGRTLFLGPEGRCQLCHGNAGATLVGFGPPFDGTNRNFPTGVEAARLAEAAALAPPDGGFGVQPGTLPPGSFGDGRFNTPPLIEAADTAPFFHTNHARTLEDAIRHYQSQQFADSPIGKAGGIIALDADQVTAVSRFLRGLNAVFNAEIAVRRTDAALTLARRFGDERLDIQRRTLELARLELGDGLRVLSEAPGEALGPDAVSALRTADGALQEALAIPLALPRALEEKRAIKAAREAIADLGSNIAFDIGAATVLSF